MDHLHSILGDIREERQTQIAKGFDAKHDDTHTKGELAAAGAAYALTVAAECTLSDPDSEVWPFEEEFTPSTLYPRRNLVKAAALIVSEIERLDRSEQPPDHSVAS